MYRKKEIEKKREGKDITEVSKRDVRRSKVKVPEMCVTKNHVCESHARKREAYLPDTCFGRCTGHEI